MFSDNEFSQEIVDDMFKIEGIWYKLEKNASGSYIKAKFAKVDDSKLIDVPISNAGYGLYAPWGMEF